MSLKSREKLEIFLATSLFMIIKNDELSAHLLTFIYGFVIILPTQPMEKMECRTLLSGDGKKNETRRRTAR